MSKTHDTDETQHSVLREKSLKAAGYTYLIADAALFASGIMAGRYSEAKAGLLYTGAAGVLARYGNENQERHMQNLNLHLSEYLDKEGMVLPDSGSISREMIAKNDGIIHKVEDFLYSHPSEVANAVFAYGGSELLRSGLQHHKPLDALGGGAVTAGALAGILIPESKGPHKRTGNIVTDSWSAIKEKPLMATGSAYMVGNVALIGSALSERRVNPANKSYVFKLLTAAGYIVANGLMAVSSKDTGPSADDKDLKKVYQGAARIIAAQPAQVQEATLRHVAGFLATQPETDVTTRKAELMLHKAVEKLACNQTIDTRYAPSWQERTENSSDDMPSIAR